MERKPDIETKINETLDIVKKTERIEVPAFFTDKTVQRLRSSEHASAFSYSGLLKIAAVVVLLGINVYTIQYILNSKQDNVVNPTVTDVLNEYQPNDGTELTFENFANER